MAIDRGLKAKGHSLKDIRSEGEVWRRGNGEEEVIEVAWRSGDSRRGGD